MISRFGYRDYCALLQTLLAKKSLSTGKKLHGRLLISGFGFHTILATKLVTLYSTCNSLDNAHKLFDRIPKENIYLWNVLIRGYAWHGPHEMAIKLYYEMINHGILPDSFTFPFMLKACSALSAIDTGKEVHELAVRTGWEKDVFVGAGIVDMYAKCGCVADARDVFDRMSERDVVVWNTMIGAYTHNGRPLEAIDLLKDMVLDGFSPTVATLVTVISASADSATLLNGRVIHGFSVRRGYESDDKVKTALVDMYSKSGWVAIARRLFEKLTVKRVVSWNAMINGYAMHGHAGEALNLFYRMEENMVVPDNITFVGVLSACSSGRLLEDGRRFFNLLTRPTIQHYTCMIHLLGHSGRLDQAYDLINQMPMQPDSGVWGSLLNACKIHRKVELGEVALQKLIELEPDDAGNYVLLANIYAQAGKWEEAAKLRNQMVDLGLKKTIACSWIDVKNTVHAFVVGDTSHPQSNEIYSELDRIEGLMAEAGYVADTMPVFHDVDDDEKKNMVRSHSERLAVAYGLISTPPETKLLITKNLRVCEDCHAAIKLISRISNREIIVRDVNRYHNFRNGECSCKDYW